MRAIVVDQSVSSIRYLIVTSFHLRKVPKLETKTRQTIEEVKRDERLSLPQKMAFFLLEESTTYLHAKVVLEAICTA